MPNQYDNPIETKLKYIEPQNLNTVSDNDIKDIKKVINQLSQRISELEAKVIRSESELKTIRDIAKAAARKR
jgi:cob(I)alamin adenosyltransferase